MNIHILLAIIILVFHMFYVSTDSKVIKNIFWYIGCFLIWLIVGFRSSTTGSDTIGYVGTFQYLSRFSFSQIGLLDYRDLGYYYLNKLLSMVSVSQLWFLTSTAFLSLIGLFDVVKRNAVKPLLTLFFYITIGNYLFILTGIRQAIAMSMCMLSVRYIQNRKLIPFIIFVCLGALCHKSALIFIPTYFLSHRKINVKNLLITATIVLIGVLFYSQLLDIVNMLLGYEYGIEEIDNGVIFYMVIIIVIILGWLTKREWIKNDEQIAIMNMGIIAMAIWTFRLIGRTAERPSMYWLNFIPLVLSNSLGAIKNKSDYVFLIFIAVCCSMLLFTTRLVGAEYAFYWQ
ncbi:MAG: EpsG family protein [Bacillota bacterium]